MLSMVRRLGMGVLSFWGAGVGGGSQKCVIKWYTWRARDRENLPQD